MIGEARFISKMKRDPTPSEDTSVQGDEKASDSKQAIIADFNNSEIIQSTRTLGPIRVACLMAKACCLFPVTNVKSIGKPKQHSEVRFAYKSWTFFLTLLAAVFLIIVIPTFMDQEFPENNTMGSDSADGSANVHPTHQPVERASHKASLGELQDAFFMDLVRKISMGQVGTNYYLHLTMVAKHYPALLNELQMSAREVKLTWKSLFLLKLALLLTSIWFSAATIGIFVAFTMPFVSEYENTDTVAVYAFKYLFTTMLNMSLGAAPDILFVVVAMTLEQLIAKNFQKLHEDIRYHRGRAEEKSLESLNMMTKLHFKLCSCVDKVAVIYSYYHGYNFVVNMAMLGIFMYFGIGAKFRNEDGAIIAVNFYCAFIICVRIVIIYEAAVRPQIQSDRMLMKLSKASSEVKEGELQEKLTTFLVKAKVSPVKVFSDARMMESGGAHRAGLLALLNTTLSGVVVMLQPTISGKE